MTEIHVEEVDRFQAGRRILMRATQAGVTTRQGKDGVADIPFAVGDVLLADDRGGVFVGPVSVSGAVDMAERILEGDQRTITDPLAMLALATAIVGFAVQEPPPPAREPAAAAMAVPA